MLRSDTFLLLEARDVIIQNLRTLFLTEQIIREQLELHDHVGKPGGNLLLEEQIGVCMVMRLPVIQQFFDRYWGWGVPVVVNMFTYISDQSPKVPRIFI